MKHCQFPIADCRLEDIEQDAYLGAIVATQIGKWQSAIKKL